MALRDTGAVIVDEDIIATRFIAIIELDEPRIITTWGGWNRPTGRGRRWRLTVRLATPLAAGAWNQHSGTCTYLVAVAHKGGCQAVPELFNVARSKHPPDTG